MSCVVLQFRTFTWFHNSFSWKQHTSPKPFIQQLHNHVHVFQMILHWIFMEFAAVLMNFSAVETTASAMQLNTSCIRCASLTTSSTITRELQNSLHFTCMMLWIVKVDATGSNVLETCRSLANVQKMFNCGAFRKLWTVAMMIFRCLAMYVQFQRAVMLTSSWIQVQMWLWHPCLCQMLDVRRHKPQKHTSEMLRVNALQLQMCVMSVLHFQQLMEKLWQSRNVHFSVIELNVLSFHLESCWNQDGELNLQEMAHLFFLIWMEHVLNWHSETIHWWLQVIWDLCKAEASGLSVSTSPNHGRTSNVASMSTMVIQCAVQQVTSLWMSRQITWWLIRLTGQHLDIMTYVLGKWLNCVRKIFQWWQVSGNWWQLYEVVDNSFQNCHVSCRLWHGCNWNGIESRPRETEFWIRFTDKCKLWQFKDGYNRWSTSCWRNVATFIASDHCNSAQHVISQDCRCWCQRPLQPFAFWELLVLIYKWVNLVVKSNSGTGSWLHSTLDKKAIQAERELAAVALRWIST